ncbi:MAG: MFS transporter [Sulfitobacter sp.]|nr:MFS transporter [Sulfitobacter sp.]
MARNVALYPWFKLFQNLIFWQAIWFLFFQKELSAAEALLLYAVYDVGTTLLEVPSGYMSDRLGRKPTLATAMLAGAAGSGLIAFGEGFGVFALAQVLLGMSAAFASGTDSAFLYESLAADGREEEVEAEETRGWQFTLTGLALSAVIGGLIAQVSFEWAFVGGAMAMVLALGITLRFVEPTHRAEPSAEVQVVSQFSLFRAAMGKPVLVWLLVLSVLMYGFSHVPFVFGQPFISEALDTVGWQGEAPLVSGAVTAAMMLVSVGASLIALALRQRIGLPAILLLAFGIQIGLIATLAATNNTLAIAVLLLRMVPNSFSKPFIVARIQPLLTDAGRATYLSIQSFIGRLLFAGSLYAASGQAPRGGEMAYDDIQSTLFWYAVVGSVAFVGLALTARRSRVRQARSIR